jgi:amidophosphoribosyltransferase
VAQSTKPAAELKNHVKRIYAAFSDKEIAAKAAELVYPTKSGWKGELVLVFQQIKDLHKACPTSQGDWYFTGDYPTPGGYGVLNQAFINFWEKREGRAY